jgi:hypothetical protein
LILREERTFVAPVDGTFVVAPVDGSCLVAPGDGNFRPPAAAP